METIVISLTVDQKQSNTCSESVPFDGIVKFVRVSFPDSKNTVGARIIIDGQQILPSRGDTLIDNGVVEIPTNFPVSEGSQIVLFVGNKDKISSHTVVATIGVEQIIQEQNSYGISQATIEGIPPEEGVYYEPVQEYPQQYPTTPGPVAQMMPGNGVSKNGTIPPVQPKTFVSEDMTPLHQLPPPPGLQRIQSPAPMRHPPVFPPTVPFSSNNSSPQQFVQKEPWLDQNQRFILLLILLVVLVVLAITALHLHYGNK